MFGSCLISSCWSNVQIRPLFILYPIRIKLYVLLAEEVEWIASISTILLVTCSVANKPLTTLLFSKTRACPTGSFRRREIEACSQLACTSKSIKVYSRSAARGSASNIVARLSRFRQPLIQSGQSNSSRFQKILPSLFSCLCPLTSKVDLTS